MSHPEFTLFSLAFLSQVYGPDTTQKDMFDGTVKELVKHVLEGGNSLVFTYGATNAGKTFSFLGLYFFHIMLCSFYYILLFSQRMTC